MTQRVAIAGSTGSIGRQTLEVIGHEPERFKVAAIGAAKSTALLAEQARRWHPDVVAIADSSRASELHGTVPAGVEVRAGPDALASIGAEVGVDIVMNAVVGFAGLPVTLAALQAGRRLALANKESLIAAGPVVAVARRTPGAEVIPVDSEHCAVHQCLQGVPLHRIRRIVLTASGGPFRGRGREELAGVTIEDALVHPTWQMGPKITVDSSTLVNKGLEVIEAHELFGVSYDQIDVVVHPQSIVHSMVEMTDGATLAQLSEPDMRLPISYALAFPDRGVRTYGALDWWSAPRKLEFAQPDHDAFPALRLCYEAGRTGGTAPAWLSAANEVAVAAFLAGELPWIAIPDVIKATLDRHNGGVPHSADEVIAADREARRVAAEALAHRISAPC